MKPLRLTAAQAAGLVKSGPKTPQRGSKARQSTVPSEYVEAKALVKWATDPFVLKAQPDLWLLYAVPNFTGDLPMQTRMALKATGRKAGVPDYCLPVPRGEYHGLYIELKRQKGGVPSDEQREWIMRLIGQGYCVRVCNGAQAAISTIEKFLDGEL